MPPTGTRRRIEYVDLDTLVPAPRNPKGHDLAGIRDSIDRFGIIEVTVLDDRTGRILSGHGRTETLALAKAAGVDPPDGVEVTKDGRWLVPVVRGWFSRSDPDAEAALVGVNHLVTKGGWVNDDLAALLTELEGTDQGLAGTGYDHDELADLLAGLEAERIAVAAHDRAAASPDDEPTPEPPADPVTKPGDVWLLGVHRLMCGDSRNPDHVAQLLAGAKVNLAVTSPPYADRRDYDEASGFRPIHPDAYVDWFEPVQEQVAAHLAADGSWFVNIKPGATPDNLATELYVLDLVAAHARRWGWNFATEFCWERGGMPGHVIQRFKNQFEPVYQFTRGRWKIRPDAVAVPSSSVIIPLGPGTGASTWADAQGSAVEGRTRVNADRRTEGMAFPGNRLPTFTGSHEATGHTAAFPVGLPAWFVRAFTDPGDRVYDPFTGSGSTLLAAHQEQRIGYGMELSAAYCDVTLARFQRHTGLVPVLEATGEHHDFTQDAN